MELPRDSLRPFALASAATFLSRLPFLGPGYGLDADAWRVAWSSHVLATTGRYEASRFPGYPVQEIAGALLIRLHPDALVLASALFAAIAAGVFAVIVRRLGGRDAVLAGLALASVPALFLGSVQALDYPWALAFSLAALLLVLDGRPLPAGLCLGIASGCRITSLLWLPALVMIAAWRRPPAERGSGIAKLVLATAGAAVVALLPLILTYGTGFLRAYGSGDVSPLIVAKNATVDLWGIPGAVAVGLGALAALWRAKAVALPVARPGGLMAALATSALLFVLAFLRLPHEAAYLLPVAAIVLLVLGLRLPVTGFRLVCVALLLSPWLLKVSQPGKPDAPDLASARPIRIAGQPFLVDVLHGPLLTAQARRQESDRYVDRVLEATRRLRPGDVVVAREWLPRLRVRLGGKQQAGVLFTWEMDAAESARLLREGHAVWTLAGVPAVEGARPLP